MAGPHPSTEQPVDAACSAEQIHLAGSVQPHGVLLAADPERDLALVAASANAGAVLADGADPLRRTVADLLGADFAQTLRSQAGGLSPATPLETTLDLGRETPFHVACHRHAGVVVMELEPVDPAAEIPAHCHVSRAIGALRRCSGLAAALSDVLLPTLRALTGFERALVYRFDPDWHGEAIAEDRAADWPHSLLGLHFPASDIPSQARALYRRSPLRAVASRDAEPVPILMAPGWTTPLDLSHAHLRSLSPSHLDYHRNLGVDGAMSLSILIDDELWGLVVCHHREPHRTTPAQRAAAMSLTDALAMRIAQAERAHNHEDRRMAQRRFATLVAHMAQVDDLPVALTSGPVTLRDLFDAPGAAVVHGGNVALLGSTPPQAEVRRLAAAMAAAPPSDVMHTTNLAALDPSWTAHAGTASGVLAAFLSDDRADMLLWFRPEQRTTLDWGGNPNKLGAAPRASFERWTEERRGHSAPWTADEVEAAGMLRHAITEVIVRNQRRIAALNDQLRQSQKMEAVGQLTGGLAHDFNNLLGGITGSLELALRRLAQGRVGDLERFIAAALGAAGRAASLTHRLLAFSRRQTLDPKPVNANRLVGSLEELIRRTVSPAIIVSCITSPGLWSILCDANQLENALLNLALNARDAMPNGGQLTIEAINIRLDDAYATQFEVPAGQYVALSVSDTGVGMPPEVAARAFEPFFTTKPLGAGTGLGLSMVYGFAKQSGGHARIYSEVGHGTTVRLYMPRVVDDPARPQARSPSPEPSGAATILVVDDEPVLRMLVLEVLAEHGYDAVEAVDGREALAILGSPARIDLLVSDVGLPGGINGRQVLEAARALRPGLKALFITGYAENAALGGGLLDPVTQVMTKPFGMEALLERIRSMLA